MSIPLKRPLTLKQVQLVVHVANGMTMMEIARHEMLSYHTVQNYLNRARDRIEARNLAHLVALCIASGIIIYGEEAE